MDRGAFILPALGAVVLAAVAYSEFITAPPKPDNKVHVVYWEKWTDFEFKAIKDVVDAFNQSQDRIQVDITSVSDIQNKTLMAVSGKIPPDIAGLYGNNVTQYADENAVINLDDMCREAGIKREDYIPVFWDMGVVRGHVYSLPSCPASIALHYNTDMFKQAGLDPAKPPKTFEELDADAAKMTKMDSNGHVLISGFLPAEPGWWNYGWGIFFGARLDDGHGRLTINSPENIRAYTWVQSYSKKYGASSLQSFRSGFGGFDSPQNAFMTQKNAMELQGVWMYNFITKYAKDLHWSVAPFPYPADRKDLENTSIADEDVLCIPTGAKHPKEAFEFIKYVESQKGMEKLCLGQKKFTPLLKVSDDFIKHHPNPYIQLFIDLAKSPNCVAPPKIGIWPQYSDEINSAFDSISLMKATPKEALDNVVRRMQPIYDDYNERLRIRGIQ